MVNNNNSIGYDSTIDKTLYSSIWKEVSKSNPCPICGKPDWCSASENGDAALCRRTDFAPSGWKEIKKSTDGYPIYVVDNGQQQQEKPWSARPRKIHNSKKTTLQPAPIPEGELTLAKLSAPATDSPKPKLKHDYKEHRDVTSIEYWYSQTQWVERWEWENPDKPKGREKTFKQHHYFTDPDGVKWDKLGKGDNPWSAYRLDEALVVVNEITGVAVLLLPEGEKCVEALREIKLAAITFQGSSWSKDSEAIIQQLAKIPNLVLGILPDYDSAGEKKSNNLRSQCDRAGLPSLTLSLKQIYPDLQEKEDCVEAIAAMGSEEFIRRLEEEIHRAVNQKRFQDEVAAEADEEIDEATDLDRKLKLDIQLLIKETDPIRRLRLRSEICSFYRIAGKDLENVVAQIKRSQSAKQTRAYSFDELLELETEALNWLIPELLPVGETIILSAAPKAGKTLLSVDAAFAVATGESSFLGETTKQGKVLLVEADESLTSTRAKLLKRGFRKGDNLQVLPVWDVSQMDKLETMLEDFRPDLVIVDSLRRIHHGSTISENSAEFADTIYTLKELFNRYKASGILIHHSNKDKDAMGVGKLRGSSAIAGAVWGTWQLDHIPILDPDTKKLIIDPKDPRRVLSVYARDTEGQTMRIELDLENNSWIREQAEEDAEAKTLSQRILHLLGKNSHLPGLSGKEIIELLEEGKAVYTALNRMTNKLLISCHPAPGDRRVNLYSLPKVDVPVDLRDSPPPIPTVPIVDYQAETYTEQGLDNSQQISHHPLEISHHLETENTPADFLNPDSETVPEIVITSDKKRGGVGVPCANLNDSEEGKTVLKVGDHAQAQQLDLINPVVVATEKPEVKTPSTVPSLIGCRVIAKDTALGSIGGRGTVIKEDLVIGSFKILLDEGREINRLYGNFEVEESVN